MRFKTGNECFQVQGEPAGFTLFDYWQWSGSDLLSNTLQGVIAEFLVAKALGVANTPRLEWGWYDLATATGQKIEVKSAAYHQSWLQKDHLRFGSALQPPNGYGTQRPTLPHTMKNLLEQVKLMFSAFSGVSKILSQIHLMSANGRSTSSEQRIWILRWGPRRQ